MVEHRVKIAVLILEQELVLRSRGTKVWKELFLVPDVSGWILPIRPSCQVLAGARVVLVAGATKGAPHCHEGAIRQNHGREVGVAAW